MSEEGRDCSNPFPPEERRSVVSIVTDLCVSLRPTVQEDRGDIVYKVSKLISILSQAKNTAGVYNFEV